MAWVGIRKGKEVIVGQDEDSLDGINYVITLPDGTIEKLTGKKKITELIKLE